MIRKIKIFFERIGLKVVERISKKIGISSSTVRIYLIYSCFVFLGLPYLLYLFLSLIFKIKDFILVKRKSVFDL